LAFTIGLYSSVPSQPPTAPAKQEDDNDDNKQAQRLLAGHTDLGEGGNGWLVVLLACIHFLRFLSAVSMLYGF
jgi:hypothetical protein